MRITCDVEVEVERVGSPMFLQEGMTLWPRFRTRGGLLRWCGDGLKAEVPWNRLSRCLEWTPREGRPEEAEFIERAARFMSDDVLALVDAELLQATSYTFAVPYSWRVAEVERAVAQQGAELTHPHALYVVRYPEPGRIEDLAIVLWAAFGSHYDNVLPLAIPLPYEKVEKSPAPLGIAENGAV